MKDPLTGLGISSRSVHLYLELLQNGRSSVDQMSKATGIKRTSIYPLLRELQKYRLVTWDERQKDDAIEASDPKYLLGISRKKLDLFRRNHEKLEEEVVRLSAMRHLREDEFFVEKYIGIENCKKLLQDVYSYKRQAGYCGEFVYEDLGRKWYEDHLRTMYKINHIHDRVLFSADAVKTTKYRQLLKTSWYDPKYCHYRVSRKLMLPENMDVYILDDRVMSFFTENEPKGIVVKSKKHRDYEMALFESIWSSAIDIKEIR